MKRIRFRTIFIFALAALSGAMLLYTSQNVQQAERELANVNNAIAQEEEAIRVLNAEWAYLNSPSRIEALAAEYLKMKAPKADQLVLTPSVLPEQPTHPETLLQPVSQTTTAPAETPPVVTPLRKPEIPGKSFNDLLDKIEKGDAQ